MTEAQPSLPSLDWPALIPGPVFICFELEGKPGHKGRHRSRIVIPREAWTVPRDPRMPRYITEPNSKKIFMSQYPDPETEAYEKVLAEVAGLFMNRARHNGPTEGPVALLVHSYREIPKSWSRQDQERARAANIRPTSRPDWDNYGKITDALNEVVWKDDSQVVDGRVLKYYSDRPALRVEVRRMIEPNSGDKFSPG